MHCSDLFQGFLGQTLLLAEDLPKPAVLGELVYVQAGPSVCGHRCEAGCSKLQRSWLQALGL